MTNIRTVEWTQWTPEPHISGFPQYRAGDVLVSPVYQLKIRDAEGLRLASEHETWQQAREALRALDPQADGRDYETDYDRTEYLLRATHVGYWAYIERRYMSRIDGVDTGCRGDDVLVLSSFLPPDAPAYPFLPGTEANRHWIESGGRRSWPARVRASERGA